MKYRLPFGCESITARKVLFNSTRRHILKYYPKIHFKKNRPLVFLEITYKNDLVYLTLHCFIYLLFSEFFLKFIRLCRGLKRLLMYLKSWILPLCIFIPTCILILNFVRSIDRNPPTESILSLTTNILLGSVLLLTCKEFIDKEAQRKKNLIQLRRFYDQINYDFIYLLKSLTTGSAQIAISYDSLRNNEEVETLKKIIRTIPKSQIRPQVKAIKESLILCDSISAQIQHSSFLELLGSSDYLVLYETLASIKQLLSNLSQDPVDNRSLIVNIIDSMHGFLAALRRIWKLPRDVKINQTLDIYIQKK